MAKRDKHGNPRYEHGTFVQRRLLESEAWRAMSPKAQMLYIWLRLEWKGKRFNNNGRVKLSCRQAAFRLGVGVNAAMTAFHELQAKGFITITRLGALGVEGEARGPTYELTDLPTLNALPRHLYLEWPARGDFDVKRHGRRK